MTVVIYCPNPECGSRITVAREELAGPVRCGHCGKTFRASRSTAGPAGKDEPARDTARVAGGQPTPRPPAADVPERIGRFPIRARLGAGAFGTVYRAYDPQLDREVALKVPQAGTLEAKTAVERFLREAKAAARLRHPHIVAVHEAGRDGEHYYIAAEFIPGRTLAHAIDDATPDARRAAAVVRQLAEALAYAHGRGIVHRDVKPANVMLDERGEAHLMDFGLAHRQDVTTKLTRDGAIMGTPAYMAPEQAQGQAGDPLPASDQYALGVVLYELLTCRVPFEGPAPVVLFNTIHSEPLAPRRLNPWLPADMETVCLKAMAKRPQDRYAGCRELADDLRRWLEDEPVHARRLGAAERLLRWCRRNPALAIMGAVAVLLLGTVALISAVSAVQLAALSKSERAQADLAQANAAEADLHRREAQASAEKAQKSYEDARKKEQEANEAAGRERRANEQVRDALSKAQASEQRAVAEAGRARRSLYVAHLNLAQRAWDSGDIARVQQLLDGQRPEAGQDDLRGFEWYHLWRLGHAGRTLPPFRYSIHAVAVGPDGRTLAVSDSRLGVAVWDLAEARERRNLPRRRRENAVLAFAPDGKTLAVSDTVKVDRTDLGVVELWDTAAWRVRATLKGHGRMVRALAFSPDGARLASCDDGGVTLWDPSDGKELRTIQQESGESFMGCLAFTPEGKTLATATADDVIRLWNAQTGEKRGELKGHTRWVEALAFAPDGRTLASAADDGTVRLWDALRRQGLAVLRGHGEAQSLAFSRDGKTLASGGHDQVARLWDVEGGRLLTALPHGAPGGRLCVAFAPAAGGLVTAGGDAVRVWDEARAAARATLTGAPRPFTYAALSGDGRTVAAGGDDGPCRVWDVATGREHPPLPLPAGQGRRALLSPDGKTLAESGRRVAAARKPEKSDVGVWLWDVATAKERAALPGTEGAGILVFSPDGGTLALTAENPPPDARGCSCGTWPAGGGGWS